MSLSVQEGDEEGDEDEGLLCNEPEVREVGGTRNKPVPPLFRQMKTKMTQESSAGRITPVSHQQR